MSGYIPMEDSFEQADCRPSSHLAAEEAAWERIREGIRLGENVVLVVGFPCTIDTAGQEIFHRLQKIGADVKIACLWVGLPSVHIPESAGIAQIIAEYVDRLPERVDHLVIVDRAEPSLTARRAAALRFLKIVKPGGTVLVSGDDVLSGQDSPSQNLGMCSDRDSTRMPDFIVDRIRSRKAIAAG